MNNLHGLIMAYRSNNNLGALTQHRNTSSLPVFGRYRLIDFMLSNYVNAGISDVGILVHESYQSLLDHIGTGKDWDLSRKRGGLRILPPFGGNSGEYRGSLEALNNVRSYLAQIRQDYIITSWGDFAMNLDVAAIYEQHISTGADVTMVCSDINRGDSLDVDFIQMDETGRVTDIAVRPPAPVEGHPSLEVYVLSKKLLLEMLDNCIAHGQYSINRHVIAANINKMDIRAYVHTGYAARPLSIGGYFSRSMELLDPATQLDLFNPNRPIRTKDMSYPPTYYGPESRSVNSLISDGCFLEGTVANSILSRDVIVEAGAKVENCILMQGTVIHAGASISHVITDKKVTICSNCMLAGHPTYPLVIAKGSSV